MQELGFNYRITDFQCALGLSQLERLDEWVARRNAVAAALPRAARRRARGWLSRPRRPTGTSTATTCSSSGCTEGRQSACAVFAALRDAGIGVQVHYIPIYRHPYYRDASGTPGRLPGRRGLLRRRDLAADVSRR